MNGILIPLAVLMGLLIGSFLNVCIYRWPRDLSVVKPRSHCTDCERQIAWYDNIPLLSYALLGGRCRGCSTAIPWRYPVVEALTALAFGWFFSRLGPGLPAIKMCLFAAMMIGLIFSDLETRLLPDEFTLGGMYLGFVFSLAVLLPDTIAGFVATIAGIVPPPRVLSLGESLLGAGLPAGALWLMGWLFEKIRHKEGLGFGDVKMIAMMGAFLGLRDALTSVIIGSLLGSVVGLAWIKLTGKDAAEYQLPFASFLGTAGLAVACTLY
jgi:leader peptidase (prepilin peptidase)/N-methyltransferase